MQKNMKKLLCPAVWLGNTGEIMLFSPSSCHSAPKEEKRRGKLSKRVPKTFLTAVG